MKRRSPAGFKCEASGSRTWQSDLLPFGLFFYGDSDKPIFMIGSHHLMKGFGLSYGRHSLVPYELFLMWRIHRTHNPRLDSGNRH